MYRARIQLLMAAALASIVVVGPLRADEDPAVRGKKVSEWFKFLREEMDPRRRQAALTIIDTQAGPKVGIVLPGLLKELREHPDPVIRSKIVELLPRYKEKADEVLTGIKTALLTDQDARVRRSAAVTLGKLDRPGAFAAVHELGEALKDKDAGTRAAAAETIGLFSRTDPEIARETIPALGKALEDADSAVRLQAAFALGRMGESAAAAVGGLAAALAKEKDAAVRKEIVKTLAAIGGKAGEAAPALIKALQDMSVEVRQAAAIALGRISPDAGLVLPELLKATRDLDKSVRCYAVHAIGSLGKGALSALPDLIELLKKDNSADVRLAAIEEIAAFGPDAKSAVEALTVASKDGRPAIREAAQEALKKVQGSP